MSSDARSLLSPSNRKLFSSSSTHETKIKTFIIFFFLLILFTVGYTSRCFFGANQYQQSWLIQQQQQRQQQTGVSESQQHAKHLQPDFLQWPTNAIIRKQDGELSRGRYRFLPPLREQSAEMKLKLRLEKEKKKISLPTPLQLNVRRGRYDGDKRPWWMATIYRGVFPRFLRVLRWSSNHSGSQSIDWCRWLAVFCYFTSPRSEETQQKKLQVYWSDCFKSRFLFHISCHLLETAAQESRRNLNPRRRDGG